MPGQINLLCLNPTSFVAACYSRHRKLTQGAGGREPGSCTHSGTEGKGGAGSRPWGLLRAHRFGAWPHPDGLGVPEQVTAPL